MCLEEGKRLLNLYFCSESTAFPAVSNDILSLFLIPMLVLHEAHFWHYSGEELLSVLEQQWNIKTVTLETGRQDKNASLYWSPFKKQNKKKEAKIF